MCRTAMVRRLRTRFCLVDLGMATPDEIVAAWLGHPEALAEHLVPWADPDPFASDLHARLISMLEGPHEGALWTIYVHGFEARQPFRLRGAAGQSLSLVSRLGDKERLFVMQLQAALGRLILA